MYDDLGNQHLIVVLFIYNTRNIQVTYCTILNITAAFLLLLKTALFGLKQVLSNFTKSAFYDVDATSAKKRCSVKRNLENVALVTTSRKQHAVFDKVIICPCYCIIFP